jgi:hypothetical protein
MGFDALIKTAVQGGFVTLGDLAPSHTYVSVDTSAGVYDTATGSYVRNADVEQTVKMVLSRFRNEEIDSSIVVTTDFKILVAALDLTAVPKRGDRIHLVDGRKFHIERVMGVPGESIHILQSRMTE